MTQPLSLARCIARLVALTLAVVASPSASAKWGVLYVRSLKLEAPSQGEDQGIRFLKAFVKACPKGKRSSLEATQALGLNMPRSFAAFGEGVHVEVPDESFTLLGRKIHVYRRRVDLDGPLAAIGMDGVDGYWFLLVAEAYEQAIVAAENPDDTSRYFVRPARVMLEWADRVGWSMDGETQMNLRRLTISKFIAKMKAAGLTGRDSIPDGATAAFIDGIRSLDDVRRIDIRASWMSSDEADAETYANKAMAVLQAAIQAAEAPLAGGVGGGGGGGAGLFGL